MEWFIFNLFGIQELLDKLFFNSFLSCTIRTLYSYGVQKGEIRERGCKRLTLEGWILEIESKMIFEWCWIGVESFSGSSTVFDKRNGSGGWWGDKDLQSNVSCLNRCCHHDFSLFGKNLFGMIEHKKTFRAVKIDFSSYK